MIYQVFSTPVGKHGLRRVQQEEDKKQGKKVENPIYLPTEEEVKEVFRLANTDFESTKIALVILAFSF